MTSPEITDAAVEAAIKAGGMEGWDYIDLRMRDALTAALPHLAAGRAEAVAAGRQTMDTAPKDGTPILVWWPIVAINDDGELTDQEVGGERLVTEWNGGGWLEPDCLNGLNSIAFDDDREYAECPTLWRRLPELSLQVAVPVPADDDGKQAVPVPADDDGKQQDGFSSGDFRHTADLLRSGDESIVKATASNNLNIILAALDRASIRSALVSAPAAPSEAQDDEDRCIACDKPFKPGDMVLNDVSGGSIHIACCGPDRESYVGPGDPFPKGYAWQPAPAAEAEPAPVAWPSGFFAIGGDARLRDCATEGCGQHVSIRVERGGVGSDHCEPCARKIAAALAQSDAAGGE